MALNDDRLEDMPAAPRRRPRWLVLVLVVVLLAGATLFGGYRYVSGAIEPGGEPGESVEVAIARGVGVDGVGRALEDAGVIKSRRIFSYWTKIQGKGPYQAGKYVIAKGSGYEAVADVLTKGPEVTADRLVIPEGLTVEQIADRVGQLPGRSKDRFLQLANDPKANGISSPLAPEATKLEGLLFPSTYSIGANDDERKILQKMLDAMTGVGRRLDLAGGAQERGISPYQALIVASLIEREAKVDEDRELVSQVIYNRLAKQMLLQVDATVIYALGGGKNRVFEKDLQVTSPYNTYKVKGLPPTPIAAPGEAAIQAALEPAEGSFLYYVVIDAEGRHAFATTNQEHNANIAKARANGVRG